MKTFDIIILIQCGIALLSWLLMKPDWPIARFFEKKLWSYRKGLLWVCLPQIVAIWIETFINFISK